LPSLRPSRQRHGPDPAPFSFHRCHLATPPGAPSACALEPLGQQTNGRLQTPDPPRQRAKLGPRRDGSVVPPRTAILVRRAVAEPAVSRWRPSLAVGAPPRCIHHGLGEFRESLANHQPEHNGHGDTSGHTRRQDAAVCGPSVTFRAPTAPAPKSSGRRLGAALFWAAIGMAILLAEASQAPST
jgi:hypothetical protein